MCHLGLLAMTDDVDKRALINSSPFGGLFVIFSGDLWQLDPVANSSKNKIFATANNATEDSRTLRGKELWALVKKGK